MALFVFMASIRVSFDGLFFISMNNDTARGSAWEK